MTAAVLAALLLAADAVAPPSATAADPAPAPPSSAAAPAHPPAPPTGQPAPIAGTPFFASETCRACHPAIVEQHLESSHEQAWTNPVFQGQYLREVLPAAAADPGMAREARACVACHAPIAAATPGPLPAATGDVPPGLAGVTCDVCHVMAAVDGKRPLNGNYVLRPGPIKFGPIRGLGSWHHAYLELQTRSAHCGTCHEAVNQHGVRVKSTYSEWEQSPQARAGLQCQDCHMTVDGFSAAGQARYEKGSAAVLFGRETAAREKLFTHRFPGAHSRTQLEGSMRLTIASAPAAAVPGQPLELLVTVDNSRAGHAMPTGSADLRLLWLEVSLQRGDRAVPLPASSRWGPGWKDGVYEVAWAGPEDSGILDGDVPQGSRVYRVLLADATGHATLRSWEARRMIADTRLKAAEIRTEKYKLTVPPDAAGSLTFTAVMRYLPYSRVLTDRYGLPPARPVEVARAEKAVEVVAPRPR
jgi:hypothetical protein